MSSWKNSPLKCVDQTVVRAQVARPFARVDEAMQHDFSSTKESFDRLLMSAATSMFDDDEDYSAPPSTPLPPQPPAPATARAPAPTRAWTHSTSPIHDPTSPGESSPDSRTNHGIPISLSQFPGNISETASSVWRNDILSDSWNHRDASVLETRSVEYFDDALREEHFKKWTAKTEDEVLLRYTTYIMQLEASLSKARRGAPEEEDEALHEEDELLAAEQAGATLRRTLQTYTQIPLEQLQVDVLNTVSDTAPIDTKCDV